MKVTLDARHFTTRECAHEYIKEMLDFPKHYGANLDALYDCLCEFNGVITIENADAAADILGKYGASLLRVFRDADSENPALLVILKTY